MSWLLRHGARREGLPQDSSGCVPLIELMRYNGNRRGPWYRNRLTVLDFYHVVEHSHRFELWGANDQVWPHSVRCLHGHSIRRLGLRMDQAYYTVWWPDHIPPILIHGTKFENLESIEANGIRPSSSRPIHMTSRRYQEMVASGEVTGKLEKVDCLIHIDSELVRANWSMANWGRLEPQWFTSGYGVYLCKSVIAWAFVGFVECRQPHITLYNRNASERSGCFDVRYCTMCRQPSSAGWQICMRSTPTGICFAPLTQAGAHDMVTAAKRIAMFDVARHVLQAG